MTAQPITASSLQRALPQTTSAGVTTSEATSSAVTGTTAFAAELVAADVTSSGSAAPDSQPASSGSSAGLQDAFQNYGPGTPQGNALANPDTPYITASLATGNYVSFTPNQASAWWQQWFANPVDLSGVMPGFQPGSLVLTQAQYDQATSLQASGTLPKAPADYNPLGLPVVAGFDATTQLARLGWLDVDGTPTPPTRGALLAASQAAASLEPERYLPNGTPNPTFNNLIEQAYDSALERAMGGTLYTVPASVTSASASMEGQGASSASIAAAIDLTPGGTESAPAAAPGRSVDAPSLRAAAERMQAYVKTLQALRHPSAAQLAALRTDRASLARDLARVAAAEQEPSS